MQKKSLIGTLKTTKKANVAASTPATKEAISTRKTVRLKKLAKATFSRMD